MRTNSTQVEIPVATNSVPFSKLRRSRRVILDVPLVICGKAKNDGSFREETFTITVNAHGGLIVLENQVALGQKILLMNPKTWDEREATVAFVGSTHAGLAKVGFQFTQPAPEFWAISSPPADWNMPDCH
jgi:hypothetical protein